VPPVPAPSAPTSPADNDLDELLDRLHDEMDLERSASTSRTGAPTTAPTDVSRPEQPALAVIGSDGGLAFQPSFASFGARLVGLVVDTVVLGAWMLPGAVLLTTGSVGLVVAGVILVFVGFGAATVVYARSVATSGQSLGNRVASTTVVDARNGTFVSAGDAGLRFVLRYLVSSIFLIGFLMAFGNSQRRAFHDNAAGTVVTRPPRATWSIDDDAPQSQ
jgi:uncharacterized RDD family membrane protein YckC